VCKDFAYSIDYLRFSVPSEIGFPAALPDHEIFQQTRDGKLTPLHYYNQCVGLLAGRVDWHTERPGQGMLITMSGQDCSYAVTHGVDMLDVVSRAFSPAVGGNIGRLDFACDVFIPANVLDIKAAWDVGLLITPAQTCSVIGSTGRGGKDNGSTVYLGSRQSERVIRFYDKAKSEGIEGQWVRVELECKGEYAMALAKSMVAHGIIPAGKAFMREFVQPENISWLTDALAGDEGLYLAAIPEKETDRKRWYRDQIFPAIDQDLKIGIGRWLRFGIQGLLDVNEENEEHGGLNVDLGRKGRKFRGALKVLESRGLGGGLVRLALMYAGDEPVYQLLCDLGYVWDTKSQRWLG